MHMVEQLFPRARVVINSIITFLSKRPRLNSMVLALARKHDDLMGYRKYGEFVVAVMSPQLLITPPLQDSFVTTLSARIIPSFRRP